MSVPPVIIARRHIIKPDAVVLVIGHCDILLGGKVLHLHPGSFRLAMLLICRAPALVTHDEIFDYIWGDDPSGGPLDLGSVIRVYTTACRRRLSPSVTIHNAYSRGYWAEFAAVTQRAAA